MIVVPGRFAPLHLGHQTLLETAQAIGPVHVLVLGDGPGGTAQVIQETCPDVALSHAPQIERLSDEHVSALIEHIRQALPQATRLFGSEPAIKPVADSLGLPLTILDPDRFAMDAVSDAIAADPVAHWSLLSPASKGHLSKRLTLVGPESTGKSTIAAKLVAAHGGPLVPEYGRAYETFRAPGDYRPGELAELARIHTAHQRVLARYSGPIQIEDSDALLTAVWAEMLTGAPDQEVEAIIDPADLYLLLHWDTPWEEDPLRYFSTPRQRQEFFARIEAKLVAHGAHYITLKGDFAAREAAAEAAYAQLLATFRQDPKP